jgi:hypothetical protein
MTLSGATALGSAHAASATGSFDPDAGSGATSLTLGGDKAVEEVVYTPAAIFFRPPRGGGSLLPAGAWIAVRASDATSATRDLPQLIDQLEGVNPDFTLSELVWGGASASIGVPDTVEGAPATRYRVLVDPAQALFNRAGADPWFARALAAQLAVLPARVAGRPAPRFPAVVWVTGGGELARVELSSPGAGLGATVLTLHPPGPAVHAEPPPAGRVVDLGALTPSGERESRGGGDSDGA